MKLPIYLRPAPRLASVARYERCCRGIEAALSRRGGNIAGLEEDADLGARWYRAWNIAAMRQIWAGCFASAIDATAENGESAAAHSGRVYSRPRAPISPVRSRPAAAGKRKPRGCRRKAPAAAAKPRAVK